jgi:hypothetical protein
MSNFVDFLERPFKTGDWFIQVNGSRSVHLCRVTGFRKSRMHFIRVYKAWQTCTGYTINMRDCAIFPDDQVPVELQVKSQDMFLKMKEKLDGLP